MMNINTNTDREGLLPIKGAPGYNVDIASLSGTPGHQDTTTGPPLPPRKELDEASGGMASNELDIEENHLSFNQRADNDILRVRDELKNFRRMYEASQAELQQKQQEAQNWRDRHRKAALELNKLKSQDQVGHQVTDKELSEKVAQLRYNIKNFSFQHFEGELPSAKLSYDLQQRPHETINDLLRMSLNTYSTLMQSRSGRPKVVQALVWAFIYRKLLEQFRWASDDMGLAMFNIVRFLKPDEDCWETGSGQDTKRRSQMWKANTSNLVLEAMRSKQEDYRGLSEYCVNDIRGISSVMRPFSGTSTKELSKELFGIIHEALDLDKLISTQVAEVTWLYEDRNGPFHFDDREMEWDRDSEKISSDSQSHWFVTAPGLFKRGKSTGEDFDTLSVLFKMEVTRTAVPGEQLGEKGRPSGGVLRSLAHSMGIR